MSKPQVQNPVGNTGLKLQDCEIGADYINLTGSVPDRAAVTELFEFVACAWEENDGLVWTEDKAVTRGRYYEHSARTVHGVDLAFQRRSDGAYDVRVSIPAKVVRRVPQVLTWAFCKELYQTYELKPTRFDIALDDYQKRMTPEQIDQALAAGNYVGFRSYSHIKNGGKKRGWTYYFGSRQSDKIIRYYDKSAETKGAIDSYRFEVELKGYKAEQFWQLFVSLPDELSEEFLTQLYLEVVVGSIDFRDRQADSNISRCPRLDWWQNLIDDLKSSGGVKLAAKRKESCLQKTIAWISSQVETSLAVLRDVLGAEQFHHFVRGSLVSGRTRYTGSHRAMIRMHERGWDEMVNDIVNNKVNVGMNVKYST